MMKGLIYACIVATALAACKGNNQAYDVTESDAFTGPSSEQPVNRPVEQKETKQPTERQPGNQGASKADNVDPNASRLATTDLRGTVKNKFWDNRKVYFFDQVGGVGDKVYEAIKGLGYWTNTVILVYATDEHMEGTGAYARLEQTMESTRLDDRIFVWVHLDKDHNVKFVRKLYSDNIANSQDEANYTL